MSTLKNANKKIEEKVVGTYKKIEDGVVGEFNKIKDKFVDSYLKEEGETTEEAEKRIKKEQIERVKKHRELIKKSINQ